MSGGGRLVCAPGTRSAARVAARAGSSMRPHRNAKSAPIATSCRTPNHSQRPNPLLHLHSPPTAPPLARYARTSRLVEPDLRIRTLTTRPSAVRLPSGGKGDVRELRAAALCSPCTAKTVGGIWAQKGIIMKLNAMRGGRGHSGRGGGADGGGGGGGRGAAPDRRIDQPAGACGRPTCRSRHGGGRVHALDPPNFEKTRWRTRAR